MRDDRSRDPEKGRPASKTDHESVVSGGAKPVSKRNSKDRGNTGAAIGAVQALPGLVERGPGTGSPHVVTEQGIGAIAAAAAGGYSRNGIAALLGMSRKSLALCAERQPAVAAALQRGEAALEHELVMGLVRQAREGAFVPAIFLLKSKFGYVEGALPDAAKPTININIPPPMSADELAKFLDERRGVTIDQEKSHED